MLGVNLPLGGVELRLTLSIAIQIVFKLYQTFLLANINKLSKANKQKTLPSELFVYFETDFVYFESHFTHFKHSLSNFKHQNNGFFSLFAYYINKKVVNLQTRR